MPLSPSLVQSAAFTGANNLAVSLSNVNVGDLIVITSGFNASGGTGPTMVSSSGVYWLDGTGNFGKILATVLGAQCGLYYGIATASSVSATIAGNAPTEIDATIWEFSTGGISYASASTNFSGGSPRAVSITPNFPNQIVVGAAARASGGQVTAAPGAPWTASGALPAIGNSVSVIDASGAIETASWTGTGGQTWALGLNSFMASAWQYHLDLSAQFGGTTGPIGPQLVKPALGDLMVVAWWARGTGGAPTGPTITDTGSGGWNQIANIAPTAIDSGQVGMLAMWWKIAAAADVNGGAGFSVTITGHTGGTGQSISAEVDVFRITNPGTPAISIDLAANTTAVAADGTTASWSPSVGSGGAGQIADELCVTFLGAITPGAPAGSNTFTGVTTAANLKELQPTGFVRGDLVGQYMVGVQASPTAGSNVFANQWTNSVKSLLAGATFYYLGGDLQVMIV